jgi:transposase
MTQIIDESNRTFLVLRLAVVERWTRDGESGRQIATRLGVTRRAVNRLRATCRQRQVS